MRWGINGEREESDRGKMSKRIQRGREREQCLALISQSVAHPAAEAAFVTMTDPRCLDAARHQHHYSTLLMYTHTRKHTQKKAHNTYSKHTRRGGNARYIASTHAQVWLMCWCEIYKDTQNTHIQIQEHDMLGIDMLCYRSYDLDTLSGLGLKLMIIYNIHLSQLID